MPLTDSLPIRDANIRTLAYDNTLDRLRIELPPSGDAAAVGCVQINTDNWYPDGIPVHVSNRVTNKWPALHSPGSTTPFYTSDSSKHTFQYEVEGINTSLLVVASGSIDASGWFNMNPSGTLTRHTENGLYGMMYDCASNYVTFSFFSETGGTSAIVTPQYLGGK